MSEINMPWYLIVKVWLLKVWAWCKKHWQLLVGIAIPLLIGILLKQRWGAEQAQETVAHIQDSHRREVAAIDESHRIAAEKVQEAQLRRDVKVAEVEAQAVAAHVDLDEKKKREIRKLVQRHENDPDALTRELSRTTGIAVWTGKSK